MNHPGPVNGYPPIPPLGRIPPSVAASREGYYIYDNIAGDGITIYIIDSGATPELSVRFLESTPYCWLLTTVCLGLQKHALPANMARHSFDKYEEP